MITRDVARVVERACRSKKNHSGYGAWTHHILLARKYGKLLANKIKANKEIVDLAILLHDYAHIKNYKLYHNHHFHSAQEAENLLKKFNYPQSKIEKVKECILSHRASKLIRKKSKEATCLADADAIAHFNGIASLFYLAFKYKNMNIDEANDWLAAKLKRSYNKLSLLAKSIIKDKYLASIKLFG
jgi:HD superfamily phosphodiesterase